MPQAKLSAVFALARTVALLSVAGMLTACHTLEDRPAPAATADAAAVRSNCYSLLRALLKVQSDVRYLSLIKKEHSHLRDLVKRIAQTSADGASLLDQLAQRDPSINLHDVELPPGEMATRIAIAETTTKDLLKDKGADFELTLLLSQAEALNYGWHLAEVAAKHEPNASQARALRDIAADMQRLYGEVFATLLSNPRPSSASGGVAAP